MKIDFPSEEIAKLSTQNTIITHRVSDDFDRFNIGDIVTTPWNKKFVVTGRRVITDIKDSPFAKYLNESQYEYLKSFDRIAVLRLEIS